MSCEFQVDWTTPHVANWQRILGHLAGRPSIRGLEVGCLEGRSSIWFCDHILTGPGATLTCVDPLNGDWAERFNRNTNELRDAGQLRIIRQPSCRALPRLLVGLGPWFEFIYLDGAHETHAVYADLISCWALLAPEGILIADDLELREACGVPGPALAIEAFVRDMLDGQRMERTTGDVFGQLVVWK